MENMTAKRITDGLDSLFVSLIFTLSLMMMQNAASAQDKGKSVFDNGLGILPGAELADAYVSGEYKINTDTNYVGEPFIIRYADFQYEQSKANWALKPAWEVLERETNGKIKIKPYWGNSLHAFRDGFSSVEAGISHESLCSSSYSRKSVV